MTQGKSQIVSGTNVVSKSDEIEPIFLFFLQKNKKNEIFWQTSQL